MADNDFALNPFETIALSFVRGHVLDLGCGMGNLSVAAARRGATVLAIDASAAAIERLRTTAKAENLSVESVLADIGAHEIIGRFDTIVSIGLLMFFQRDTALALLAEIQKHVVEPLPSTMTHWFTSSSTTAQ